MTDMTNVREKKNKCGGAVGWGWGGFPMLFMLSVCRRGETTRQIMNSRLEEAMSVTGVVMLQDGGSLCKPPFYPPPPSFPPSYSSYPPFFKR